MTLGQKVLFLVAACTLKTHMGVHTKKKSHVCDLCGRSFGTKSHLKSHKDRHLGLKKHQCDYCNEKFFKGLTHEYFF